MALSLFNVVSYKSLRINLNALTKLHSYDDLVARSIVYVIDLIQFDEQCQSRSSSAPLPFTPSPLWHTIENRNLPTGHRQTSLDLAKCLAIPSKACHHTFPHRQTFAHRFPRLFTSIGGRDAVCGRFVNVAMCTWRKSIRGFFNGKILRTPQKKTGHSALSKKHSKKGRWLCSVFSLVVECLSFREWIVRFRGKNLIPVCL